MLLVLHRICDWECIGEWTADAWWLLVVHVQYVPFLPGVHASFFRFGPSQTAAARSRTARTHGGGKKEKEAKETHDPTRECMYEAEESSARLIVPCAYATIAVSP